MRGGGVDFESRNTALGLSSGWSSAFSRPVLGGNRDDAGREEGSLAKRSCADDSAPLRIEQLVNQIGRLNNVANALIQPADLRPAVQLLFGTVQLGSYGGKL
jgi:hypothetical protein